ncbi:MAG: sensor histidine kinase [Lachnospiraceae bacterium]|nr:sensor histidine kinase [Lachnospiraceae bacterium]
MKSWLRRFERLKLNTKITLVILAFTFLPIAVFSGVLFYNLEQDVIDESRAYMLYKMNRESDQIGTDVDSINMSTRFFLTHEGLQGILNSAVDGEETNTREMISFYKSDVAELERLVNNNPLLYGVRVFSVTDNVQEMMPVLYSQSRMQQLDWYQETAMCGWHFGYYDQIFSSLITNQEDTIASLVTEVTDYERGTVGYIEAAVRMKTLFPSLYEDIEGESSFFIEADGTVHGSTHMDYEPKQLLQRLQYETPVEQHDCGNLFYLKEGRHYYTVAEQPLKAFGGTLYDVQDISEDMEEIRTRRNLFILVAVIMLFVSALWIDRIVRAMLRQFYSILDGIHKVQKGDLNVRVDDHGNDEMGELGTQLNKMLDRIQALMKSNIQREVLVKNSEIRTLQNQINAHFIYNVLESIKMMAEIDEKYEIADAITSLGKLLRYSMRWISGNVSLAEEVEYIRNYVLLMNLRYDFEVILSIDIPQELYDQEIPKMSLQPVVENAVLHGIEPVATDTTIYIKARSVDGEFLIEITDAGRGMNETQLEQLRQTIHGQIQPEGGSGKGHGIGLKNVEDRIQLSFGKDYGVEVFSEEAKYTKVSLKMPRRISERTHITN